VFNRKHVQIELSESLKTALASLDGDVQALVGLVDELVATHTAILEALKGDVAVLVASESGEPIVDVDVDVRVPPPAAMASQTTFEGSDEDGPDRVRRTPFTRAPRHVQVEWLQAVMADGNWYAAHSIARAYATDERHYRYMKGALSGRLREMHEEGLANRRDSRIKGSMFEYQLITPTS